MAKAPIEGVRVLRGPDWNAGEEDGGEGHLGTVMSSPSNGVVHVLWDVGEESACRAGADGKFDLRVFDTATVGVFHPDSKCSSCDEDGIHGTLWRCAECQGCDLCPVCYADDKHDVRHQFLRIDLPGQFGKIMKKRKTSVRIRTMGLFPGAKVTRGRDWSWKNQDGGEGSEGEMLEFFQLQNPLKGKRNLARVLWPHGKKNVYRLGYEGHVDILCREEEAGGFYYRDHLPRLDTNDFTTLQEKNASSADDTHEEAETTTAEEQAAEAKDSQTQRHGDSGIASPSSDGYPDVPTVSGAVLLHDSPGPSQDDVSGGTHAELLSDGQKPTDGEADETQSQDKVTHAELSTDHQRFTDGEVTEASSQDGLDDDSAAAAAASLLSRSEESPMQQELPAATEERSAENGPEDSVPAGPIVEHGEARESTTPFAGCPSMENAAAMNEDEDRELVVTGSAEENEVHARDSDTMGAYGEDSIDDVSSELVMQDAEGGDTERQISEETDARGKALETEDEGGAVGDSDSSHANTEDLTATSGAEKVDTPNMDEDTYLNLQGDDTPKVEAVEKQVVLSDGCTQDLHGRPPAGVFADSQDDTSVASVAETSTSMQSGKTETDIEPGIHTSVAKQTAHPDGFLQDTPATKSDSPEVGPAEEDGRPEEGQADSTELEDANDQEAIDTVASGEEEDDHDANIHAAETQADKESAFDDAEETETAAHSEDTKTSGETEGAVCVEEESKIKSGSDEKEIDQLQLAVCSEERREVGMGETVASSPQSAEEKETTLTTEEAQKEDDTDGSEIPTTDERTGTPTYPAEPHLEETVIEKTQAGETKTDERQEEALQQNGAVHPDKEPDRAEADESQKEPVHEEEASFSDEKPETTETYTQESRDDSAQKDGAACLDEKPQANKITTDNIEGDTKQDGAACSSEGPQAPDTSSRDSLQQGASCSDAKATMEDAAKGEITHELGAEGGEIRNPGDAAECQTEVDFDEAFKPGDRVAIRVSEDRLKELQTGFGGTTCVMLRSLGKIGVVISVKSSGALNVKFRSIVYRLNPEVLIKVPNLSVGDTVCIVDDLQLLRVLNARLPWRSAMPQTLGKVGTITDIDDDGDVKVSFGPRTIMFAPAACRLALGATPDTLDDRGSNRDYSNTEDNSFGGGAIGGRGISLRELLRDRTTGGRVKLRLGDLSDLGDLTGHLSELKSHLEGLSGLSAGLGGLSGLSGLSGIHGILAGEGSADIDKLHRAIIGGDLDKVNELVNGDRSLLNKEHNGLTPLMLASHQGKLKVARRLLDLGADVNAEGLKEQSALGVALEEREEEVALLLIERGANPCHQNGKQRTPLHQAIFNRLNEVAQILIHMGADVNVQDKYGDTPLHDAIMRGNIGIVDMLLQIPEVNVHLVNRKGYTPLQLACRVGNAEVTGFLLARDSSNVDALQNQDYSALHRAVINNFLDGVRLLVNNGGANINIRSGHHGSTPLHIACLHGYESIVEVLLEFGADVNLQDYNGETALHLAMGGNDGKDKPMGERERDVQTRIRISSLLITHGAYVDAENQKGKPPIVYGLAEVQMGVHQFIQKNKGMVRQKMGGGDNVTQGPNKSYAMTSVLRDVSLPCTKCRGASDITLIPCGHKAVCSKCFPGIQKCPLCGCNVDKKERKEGKVGIASGASDIVTTVPPSSQRPSADSNPTSAAVFPRATAVEVPPCAQPAAKSQNHAAPVPATDTSSFSPAPVALSNADILLGRASRNGGNKADEQTGVLTSAEVQDPKQVQTSSGATADTPVLQKDSKDTKQSQRDGFVNADSGSSVDEAAEDTLGSAGEPVVISAELDRSLEENTAGVEKDTQDSKDNMADASASLEKGRSDSGQPVADDQDTTDANPSASAEIERVAEDDIVAEKATKPVTGSEAAVPQRNQQEDKFAASASQASADGNLDKTADSDSKESTEEKKTESNKTKNSASEASPRLPATKETEEDSAARVEKLKQDFYNTDLDLDFLLPDLPSVRADGGRETDDWMVMGPRGPTAITRALPSPREHPAGGGSQGMWDLRSAERPATARQKETGNRRSGTDVWTAVGGKEDRTAKPRSPCSAQAFLAGDVQAEEGTVGGDVWKAAQATKPRSPPSAQTPVGGDMDTELGTTGGSIWGTAASVRDVPGRPCPPSPAEAAKVKGVQVPKRSTAADIWQAIDARKPVSPTAARLLDVQESQSGDGKTGDDIWKTTDSGKPISPTAPRGLNIRGTQPEARRAGEDIWKAVDAGKPVSQNAAAGLNIGGARPKTRTTANHVWKAVDAGKPVSPTAAGDSNIGGAKANVRAGADVWKALDANRSNPTPNQQSLYHPAFETGLGMTGKRRSDPMKVSKDEKEPEISDLPPSPLLTKSNTTSETTAPDRIPESPRKEKVRDNWQTLMAMKALGAERITSHQSFYLRADKPGPDTIAKRRSDPLRIDRDETGPETSCLPSTMPQMESETTSPDGKVESVKKEKVQNNWQTIMALKDSQRSRPATGQTMPVHRENKQESKLKKEEEEREKKVTAAQDTKAIDGSVKVTDVEGLGSGPAATDREGLSSNALETDAKGKPAITAQSETKKPETAANGTENPVNSEIPESDTGNQAVDKTQSSSAVVTNAATSDTVNQTDNTETETSETVTNGAQSNRDAPTTATDNQGAAEAKLTGKKESEKQIDVPKTETKPDRPSATISEKTDHEKRTDMPTGTKPDASRGTTISSDAFDKHDKKESAAKAEAVRINMQHLKAKSFAVNPTRKGDPKGSQLPMTNNLAAILGSIVRPETSKTQHAASNNKPTAAKEPEAKTAQKEVPSRGVQSEVKVTGSGSQNEADPEVFAVGERAAIKVMEERLTELQKEFGGTTKGMLQCLGRTGTVTDLTSRGSVCVKFTINFSYRFNPAVLIKVPDLSTGDTVRIISDLDLLQLLNKRVGWCADMSQTLGKVGKITQVDKEGDVTVSFGPRSLLFAPASCIPAPGVTPDTLAAEDSGKGIADNKAGGDFFDAESADRQAFMKRLAEMVKKGASVSQVISSGSGDNDTVASLFDAVKKGNSHVVVTMIQNDPKLLTSVHHDKSPLMQAAKEGQLEITRKLLDLGADVNENCGLTDRSALALALEAGEEETALLLLSHGANPRNRTKKNRTPLHLAAYDNLAEAVQVLIHMGADVNAQDAYGDTPLHDALQKDSRAVADVLLKVDALNIHLTSNNGANALHAAAVRGNHGAVEQILARDHSGVNTLANGEFSALHIAANESFVDIVRTLVINGEADVNIEAGGYQHKGVRPLHMTCLRGNYDTTEALLDLGALVNVVDNDLDTPLHNAMGGRRGNEAKDGSTELLMSERVRIACLLISNGAFVDAENAKGRIPLRYGRPEVQAAVQDFMDRNRYLVQKKGRPGSDTARPTLVLKGVPLPCAVCSTAMSDVTLLPCGHKTACSSCSRSLPVCPLCGCRVDSTTKDDKTGALFKAIGDDW